MITVHSEVTKPPPRLRNSKITDDKMEFNLQDVDLSIEAKSPNTTETLFPKRRSSRLIAQSLDTEKGAGRVNDTINVKKNVVLVSNTNPSTSFQKRSNNPSETESLSDDHDALENLDLIELTPKDTVDNEIVESYSNGNTQYRPGRRKTVDRNESSYINQSKNNIFIDKSHSNNSDNNPETSSDVFGNVTRLFPKTNDFVTPVFRDIYEPTNNLISNVTKPPSTICEEPVFRNISSGAPKQKSSINYLTEQALASIAINEKVNANKTKHRVSRPYQKSVAPKVINDSDIKNNMIIDTPSLSSCESIKKIVPKVNVVVSKTSASTVTKNSFPPKLLDQKTYTNVTNSIKNTVIPSNLPNLIAEEPSQIKNDLVKVSTVSQTNKFKTFVQNPNNSSAENNTISNDDKKDYSNADPNLMWRRITLSKGSKNSPSFDEPFDIQTNSKNDDLKLNQSNIENSSKILKPTSGRVVVIKSNNTKSINPNNVPTSKNIDNNKPTTTLPTEPGPSGLQQTKSFFLNQAFKNKLSYFSNKLNRKNYINDSSSYSQISNSSNQLSMHQLKLDHSPILLKGLKTNMPLNKLREMANRSLIPRSMTHFSLIYKRARRSYNFTTGLNGKIIMVNSSGKNILAKGPVEYEVLWKMKTIPSLNQFASTSPSEFENRLYQTVVVCAYFTSFYGIKMFKIVKRREYTPRSFECLPFYPTKKEMDEEAVNVPKKRKRSKSCEFPTSSVNDYLVTYVPVNVLKKYKILTSDGQINRNFNIMQSPYSPERKNVISKKVYDSKTRHLNDDNFSDDMEGELKGITVTVEIPPPRPQHNNKDQLVDNSYSNISKVMLPESRRLGEINSNKQNEKKLDERNGYGFIPIDLAPPSSFKEEIRNELMQYNEALGRLGKKTITTIYTHPNKMIKDARATIIPANNKRFYSNRDIPDDVADILDYYKLRREPTVYSDEKVENIRNFGRRMTASYQYLNKIKELELWNMVEEVQRDIKKEEISLKPEKVPGDSQSNLIQTIKGQVLKRGRGRPRKSETEKTVLEEEIIRRSDDGMADIKEIDEACLLSTEDMLIERENNVYNIEQFLYSKDNKDDETTQALASIDNDLPDIKSGNIIDDTKREIDNSYGFSLDPMTKGECDIFDYRKSPLSNDGEIERSKIIGQSTDGKECYTAIPKEDYPLYKGRCATMSLMDEMLQKNCAEIGLGVKYHTLKEMEMKEYDKVPKTEESIYGPRPNVYTQFIEENKDMFMNDCSLRYVFNEVGEIRTFPLYGDNSSIPRFTFEREDSTLFDNDSLDGDGTPYPRYNSIYDDNEDDEDEDEEDDEEEDDEDEEDYIIYPDQLGRSKQSSIEIYDEKSILQQHQEHYTTEKSTTKKQRKRRIGKPRGPYMTKRRRLEAMHAAHGIMNVNEQKKSKRPVGRPKGSTKKKTESLEPVDPASISLNDNLNSKKHKTENLYSRPTFNSILASSRTPTEYAKTKLRHVR
uniref:BRCT domain-containing protein n=1 Tax=Parastrongyloides trichosuri TaxID=131310 RepID=A0A0N5A3Y3_PARTI